MFKNALLRYNFRVLMTNNWWLLVIPLAASQLTIFWTGSTQKFTANLPSNIVETISPLLAAFLCAHLLSAEYRSQIGAVLASKPVDIRKIVLIRLAIALGLVWVLAAISLGTFYSTMEPYPILPPLIASMISCLFLAVFALTFATLFRHPLAGFGIAAMYWGLDLAPGPPINPFLSLKSLYSSIPVIATPGAELSQPLTDNWLVAKALLLVAALLLYANHNRLLFLLGSPMTVRRTRRALAFAGGTILFYIVSGGVTKVIFGYTHRGALIPNDAAWFRRQLAPYGPFPVAILFGPNFPRYLGAIPNAWRVQQDGEGDVLADTVAHRKDLQQILEKAPNSIWAPSAAELLARFENRQGTPPEQQLEHFQVLIDKYPDSPFTALALHQISIIYTSAINNNPDYEPKARAMYERLLKQFPTSSFRADAYHFLAESDQRHGDLKSAENNAKQWIEIVPVHEKFNAWRLLAQLQRQQGKTQEAKASAQQILKAVAAYHLEVQRGTTTITQQRRIRVDAEAAAAAREAATY